MANAVTVALGVTRDGARDGVREGLGLWSAGNEGAKFWLSVMNKLKPPIVGKTIRKSFDPPDQMLLLKPGSFSDPPHRFRTSSSPLWMGSRASLTPSRQPFRMLQSKPASFTRCVSGAFAAPLGPRSPPTP